METIQVRILEGGKGVEVNYLGDEPFKFDYHFPPTINSEWIKWNLAELSLRTFEIENLKYALQSRDYITLIDKSGLRFKRKINSIHQAKILENGKIEIL